MFDSWGAFLQRWIWYYQIKGRLPTNAYNRSTDDKFFFHQSIVCITGKYPILFTPQYEGDSGDTTTDGPIQRSGLAQFDIIPILLRYCKETNETLSFTLNEPICSVLYICSYAFMLDEEQKKEYEKLNRKLRKWNI